jgi:YidC/Oxa1 family membrane protein insertase
MFSFLGVPVDAAYHIVSVLSAFLTPALGGLAATAAIVLFTIGVRLLLAPLSLRARRGLDAQTRLAPQVQALRKAHAGQPDRLQRELTALYQAEGTSPFAGFLPLLLQWPLLSIMYLVFRSRTIAGVPNALLTHSLLGAPLGSHWLAGAGPLSLQGAVFAGLFLLLGVLGWLSAWVARRLAATRSAASSAAGSARPAGRARAAARGGASARPQHGAAAGLVTRLAPYLTVAIAAFLPLAAGLYLVTTTAWTLAERAMLH